MKWRTKNGRRERYLSWNPWFAWRPVRVPRVEIGGIVIPEHMVWLEHVERRRLWNTRLLFERWQWEYRTGVSEASK